MSLLAVLARVGPRNRRGIVRSGDLGRQAAPRSPVIGNWLLVMHWSLVIGHWSLAAKVVRSNLSMAVPPEQLCRRRRVTTPRLFANGKTSHAEGTACGRSLGRRGRKGP